VGEQIDVEIEENIGIAAIDGMIEAAVMSETNAVPLRCLAGWALYCLSWKSKADQKERDRRKLFTASTEKCKLTAGRTRRPRGPTRAQN